MGILVFFFFGSGLLKIALFKDRFLTWTALFRAYFLRSRTEEAV